MVRVILLVVLLVSYLDAVCCDCGRGRMSVEYFNESDCIFTGVLTRETFTDKHYNRISTYSVTRAYRGINAGDTILVWDTYDLGSCGLGKLAIGAEYLVYARRRNSEIWTSRCVGNSRVPSFILPRDSAAINRMKANRYRGYLDDTVYTTFHTDTSFLNNHLSKIQKSTVQKFYDKEEKLSAKGKYKNGLPEGNWRYYEAGVLTKYGNYISGKKDSMWVHRWGEWMDIEEYKNGEYTLSRTSFSNGKINSKEGPVGNGEKWISSAYHDNGQPRYIAYTKPPKRNDKGRLEDPVWNGSSKSFNKAGIILDEGILENGLHAGHWKYYYEDGKLRMEGEYADGKKTGVWKIYYPGKKIKATGTYDKDEKTADWKYFDKTGKEIRPDPKLIEEDEDWFTYSGVKKY